MRVRFNDLTATEMWLVAFRLVKVTASYDEETEEFVGGIEVLNGKIAELTKTANHPGGISLFRDEDKTEYKSTTELLRDISEIYDELTDKQQANLLEKLAGGLGLPEYIAICIENIFNCR